MRKIILTTLFVCSAVLSAQDYSQLPEKIAERAYPLWSIQNKETHLLINDSISINKNGMIQIYLPIDKDFMFVKRKKSVISAKLVKTAANVVSAGAVAVAYGTNNLNTMIGAVDVMNKAQSVYYGADALDKINQLPISKDAKKIAGKEMKVLEWNFTEANGWVITAEFDKKKYEIELQGAVTTGEVKL
ncbi:MAG: hypothetical protein Q4B43_09560 [Bacteroidota bacterium]|nr:hypothetical protein [Bacteroidota bacterium]